MPEILTVVIKDQSIPIFISGDSIVTVTTKIKPHWKLLKQGRCKEFLQTLLAWLLGKRIKGTFYVESVSIQDESTTVNMKHYPQIT